MSEHEDSIRRVLDDAQRRYIAKFCTEPHTSVEILKIVKENWKDYSASSLALDLRQLERIKAVVYMEDDKWKTTDIAEKVLRKYFGYKE